ncbi:unnamed protein product, partial [Callosobruchus maculatus]
MKAQYNMGSFLEDYTVVDVPKLIAALERHNHN